jgi:hypothetical protein
MAREEEKKKRREKRSQFGVDKVPDLGLARGVWVGWV